MPIPITLIDEPLYAFASIGTSSGMQIRLAAQTFEYTPDLYTDLTGQFTRVRLDHYTRSLRSVLRA